MRLRRPATVQNDDIFDTMAPGVHQIMQRGVGLEQAFELAVPALHKALEDVTPHVARDLVRRAPRILRHHKRANRPFERRLRRQWGQALDRFYAIVIFAEEIGREISWKAYYQGLPAPCAAVVKTGAYAKKTDPFAYLDDVRTSPARCHRVVPLDRLRPDLRRGRLPRFVVIVPDLRHDMHSGPVGEADVFLRRLDQELATSSSWRPGTVLVVTFDEGTTSRGLHGRGGGHVATVVTGPGVPARHDATPYTHYALLRSIEQRFGLPPLRNAADPSTRTIPAIAGSRRPT